MKLETIVKKLGEDTVQEMNAMTEVELKQVIVDASTAMRTVKDELEANEQYQEIKENLKALTQGKREVDSRQNARIQYALECIEKFGQESAK